MKKIIITSLSVLSMSISHAIYMINMPLETRSITFSDWVLSDPVEGEWTNINSIYGCSNWNPLTSTITIGQSFKQTATDCNQNQERTVQQRETDKVLGTVRDRGLPYVESKVIHVTSIRDAIGQLENWISIAATYTPWLNNGTLMNCSNWSPLPDTITINKPFIQTATDCLQPQTREKQNREKETTTAAERNVGSAIIENQNIAATSTRDSIGSKETWMADVPVYTVWTDNGEINGCSNWSPAASTVTINESFTQTATDCKQPQTRNRQNTEKETTTGVVRNIGTPIVENQDVTVSNTRSLTGSKETWMVASSTYTTWTNNGVLTSCSNWSPSPTTITVGQTFTQTATDCQQPQTRIRQDREQETTTLVYRNKGVAVTENQNIVASSTRSSTGTKETWAATTATYTTWTNNGALTSCSNWSPATSTVTVGQTFTQTATDCQQPQTRSRQDREQETTTLAIRNKGAAVTENQNIVASSTRSATGVKESWAATTPTYTTWTNNGALSNCSNWSPATSTVTVGQSFTQTATDCDQPQTRSRQDREQESTTLAYRNTGVAVIESQIIKASSTRSSIGTKESWVAATPTYTTWTNNGALTSCSNWSPATSTVTVGQSFTQTATDCQQPQTRTRQDREQESTTLAYRNKGSAVTENQNIVASSTRSATGVKETWVATTPSYGSWVNNGALTSCSNWSPATSTVALNQSFTQTATDCQQPQTRTRQNREQETTTLAIRNSGTAVNESQNIVVSSTRAATGTYVPPAPVATCLYEANKYTVTYNTSSGFPAIIQWNAAMVGSMANERSSLTVGGYRYYAGPRQAGSVYQVCRIAV